MLKKRHTTLVELYMSQDEKNIVVNIRRSDNKPLCHEDVSDALQDLLEDAKVTAKDTQSGLN